MAAVAWARTNVTGEPGGEVTELVGLCLWDVSSDNQDVIAADGRVGDIGSFRGADAFPDEYLTRDHEGSGDGGYMRFYMGTIWISQCADLTPVYVMIFRCFTMVGADGVYHFPEIGIVELAPADDTDKAGDTYSVSQAAVAEFEARQRRVEASGAGRSCGRRMRVRTTTQWTGLRVRPCVPTGRCTAVIFAAGLPRENPSALCRSFTHVGGWPAPDGARIELTPIRRSDRRLCGSDGAPGVAFIGASGCVQP